MPTWAARTAPQNPLDATDTVLTETVTPQGDAISLWVYPGISFGGSMTVTDAAGNVVFEKELNYGTCFSWTANDVAGRVRAAPDRDRAERPAV